MHLCSGVDNSSTNPFSPKPRAYYLKAADAAERLAREVSGQRKVNLLKAAKGFRNVARIKAPRLVWPKPPKVPPDVQPGRRES